MSLFSSKKKEDPRTSDPEEMEVETIEETTDQENPVQETFGNIGDNGKDDDPEIDDQLADTKRKVSVMKADVGKDKEALINEIELITNKKFNKRKYWEEAGNLWKEHLSNGIQLGVYLLALKSTCNHGEFETGCEKIEIEPRTARNYMGVAHQFYAIEEDFRKQLGMTKLYKLLRAPEEDKKLLVEEGRTTFMDREKILSISARELERSIKEHNEKLTEDLKVSEARREQTYNEKKALEKENEKLQRELHQAKTGMKDLDPVPRWWSHVFKLTGEMARLEKALSEYPVDFDDEDSSKVGEFVAEHLKYALDRCYSKLVDLAVGDLTEAKAATKRRLEDIKKKHSDWDFDAFEAKSDF